MRPLVWVLAAVGCVPIGLAIGRLLPALSGGDRDREVLPACYESLAAVEPACYPGHCTTCGTDNEPGYRICEDCGSEIPTSDEFDGDVDLAAIFGQ